MAALDNPDLVDLLEQVRAKRSRVERYIASRSRRQRALANRAIVFGSLSAFFSGSLAIGGKELTNSLQASLGLSQPFWRPVCFIVALCSVITIALNQLQKSRNYEQDIPRAQAVRASLETLEVSIASNDFSKRRATDEFRKCIRDCSFMETHESINPEARGWNQA
ncbi:MAG TPA: hypothetical protein VNT27_10955 [Propionibacteriaceae bacterium]|nr:hypothetical protein [Propionibacteriaceae bacterium]